MVDKYTPRSAIATKVSRYIDGTAGKEEYNLRKYGCKELKREWRFTTSHREAKNGEKFCIYGIADPRDHIIRYVGWTKLSLKARLRIHLAKPVGAIMKEWLGSMASAGVRPEIVALEWCNRHERKEREWIARLRVVGTLLNVTDGGRGNRHRCKCSRLRTVAGPVRTFTADEIRAMNEELARLQYFSFK